MEAIAHRMSEAHLLAIHSLPALPSALGAGDYMRLAGNGEQAMRGSGDECGDLMFSLVCLIFFIDYGLLIPPMSSRLSSRLGVPWGVSSFLSGRLIACLYRSYSSRGASRSSSRSIVSSRSSYCVPLGVSFYSRAARLSSHRVVLLGRLACPSRFFFIRLIALRICDEAFLRGRRAIRIITMGVRLVPYGSFAPCSSVPMAWAVSVPGPCYPVMRR